MELQFVVNFNFFDFVFFLLLGGRPNEALEMGAKPLNGDVQKMLKEANNLRRPCDTGKSLYKE